MDSENNNIGSPQLRFPGFHGDWVEKKLGDFFELRNGYAFKSDSYVEKGKYRIITISNVQNGKLDISNCKSIDILPSNIAKHQLLNIGDIIVSMTGNVGRVCIVDKPNCLLNQRVGLLEQTDNTMSRSYLYSLINSAQFESAMIKSGQGAAQANISKDSIESFPILLPPTIDEEEKIASCLTEIDTMISAQAQEVEAIKDHKKGLLQQIFPQSGESSPKIRFPGFTSEWEERPLSSFLREHKTKSDGKCEVHSVSVAKGVINQVEYLGRSFAAADTSKYNLVKPNDIIYTKSPTGSFPYGIIKQNKNPYNVIVSPLYAVYTPVTKYLGYILDSYFENPVNTNNYLSSLVQKGAKNTIQITNDTFVSKSMRLPSDENEQKKIAECLMALDDNITAATAKLDALKAHKKGLMQQLFPQFNQ